MSITPEQKTPTGVTQGIHLNEISPLPQMDRVPIFGGCRAQESNDDDPTL
jgi:hypothetical protein